MNILNIEQYFMSSPEITQRQYSASYPNQYALFIIVRDYNIYIKRKTTFQPLFLYLSILTFQTTFRRRTMISFPFISCVLVTCCFIFPSTFAQRQPGQCCDEYCYDTDSEKPQSSRFATKSAYQIIKGSDSRRQFNVPSK